jgi:hypothetical protein
MTTTRLDHLTREALGTNKSGSPSADAKASLVAPAMLIITVTAVLLLSGCAVNPVQQYQPGVGALNLGEATSWLDDVPAAGSASYAGR